MKGIVFTEFLEMVEQRFGLDVADRVIEAAQLPNDGAYTAVGTYDHAELLRLVGAVSEATATPAPSLVQAFGRHLFARFHEGYPALFAGVESAFAFLQGVERYIHVEVRKLYPDAELPGFSYETPSADRMVMLYQSRRPFADLADGLIQGCIAHFGEPIRIVREDLGEAAAGGLHRTRFTLTKETDE